MEVPRIWRLEKEKYRLTGNICPACETPHFPSRNVCPDCGTVEDSYSKESVQKIEHSVVQNAEAVNPSARITNPEYYRSPRNPNSGEVIPHSQKLKNEALVGAKETPSELNKHIIYQASLPAD